MADADTALQRRVGQIVQSLNVGDDLLELWTRRNGDHSRAKPDIGIEVIFAAPLRGDVLRSPGSIWREESALGQVDRVKNLVSPIDVRLRVILLGFDSLDEGGALGG